MNISYDELVDLLETNTALAQIVKHSLGLTFLDTRLTRLQGTLAVSARHILPLCFLLDGRTCKWLPGYAPPSSSIGWGMRVPTPRQQAQLPAERSRRSLGGLVSHPL